MFKEGLDTKFEKDCPQLQKSMEIATEILSTAKLNINDEYFPIQLDDSYHEQLSHFVLKIQSRNYPLTVQWHDPIFRLMVACEFVVLLNVEEKGRRDRADRIYQFANQFGGCIWD